VPLVFIESTLRLTCARFPAPDLRQIPGACCRLGSQFCHSAGDFLAQARSCSCCRGMWQREWWQKGQSWQLHAWYCCGVKLPKCHSGDCTHYVYWPRSSLFVGVQPAQDNAVLLAVRVGGVVVLAAPCHFVSKGFGCMCSADLT
jgi:hypothetical protein